MRTEEGFTTLHIAVARSQPNIVRLLLEAGADVSIGDKVASRTHKHTHIQSLPPPCPCAGHPLVIDWTRDRLDSAANHAGLSRDQMAEHTPLHLACVAGNVQVVQLLLEYAANPEQVDKAGFYPFHHAVAHKNKDVVEFLLEQGFDPNIASHKDGVTALHMAAEFNHLEIMKLLLGHGAAVTSPQPPPNR